VFFLGDMLIATPNGR